MNLGHLLTRTNLAVLLSLSVCLGEALAKMPLPDDEWFQSVNQGELLIAQKKDTEAESTLIHAVGMSYVFGAMGAATITQLLLGDFYFARGDYKNAERFYQMASIEPNPADSIRGLKSLTALYIRLNKKEQADTCRALQKKAEIKLARKAKKNADKADYTAYFKKMSERIKQYWQPPVTQKNKVVLVKFRLAPDGAISLLHVARSSGVAEADEQALRAIVATAPLPAPTPPFSKAMDMQYTFDPTKDIDPLKRNVPVKILRVDNVDVVDWPATEKALKDAIEQLETSKKAKPQIVADLMLQLGDCYFEQKDSTDSVSAYDKAMNYCLQNKVGDKIQLKCRQKLALSLELAEKHLSADKQWHLGLAIITAQKESAAQSDLDLQNKIDFLSAYARYLYVSGRTRDADGFYHEITALKKAQLAAHAKAVVAGHKK
jgi:TonB family protein